MSEGKAIYGYFEEDSTVKPTVQDVTYFDNGLVVESPMDTTEVFQVRLRFSKEMDPSVDPTIELDSDGSKDPTVPVGGTWENLIVSGDAYRTPYFGLSGDHIGTVTVKASGGTSEDGNVMSANDAVDTFTLEGAAVPTLPAVIIDEGSEHINRPEVALKLTASGATLMWISGDINDASNVNTWIDYNISGDGVAIASGDVILASGDGDGIKYVYAKFSDASGNETAFISDYIVLDRSGDAITDIACSNGSGGSAIGNASWQTSDTPYFYWTAPTSESAIRGYAYVLTSGDGTDAELPEQISTFDNYVDYAYDSVDPGKYKFIVRAQDSAENWGSGDQFDLWVASGDSFFMSGRIRAWTSGDKVTELTDGDVTSSGDSRIFIEWNDPQSPSDDTFYIQISGDNVNENDYAFSTTSNSYKFTNALGVGITRVLVRPITGLGISGDHQEFVLIWSSGDLM